MLSACQNVQTQPVEPLAKNGVLDLRDWDFEQHGTLLLGGEWQFYWEQLLEPTDFIHKQPGDYLPIETGKPWNEQIQLTVEELPGMGYATYYLRLLQPQDKDQQHLYALKLLNMSSAYHLWLNGELVAKNGRVADNKADMIPRYRPQVITFDGSHKEIEIVLQVSNFHHRRGGAWNGIDIGLEPQIRELQRSSGYFDMFLFSALLIMGLYHLGLFALRRNDRSTLYFGLFCLVIAIRSLFYREMNILIFSPDFGLEAISKLRYILTFAAVPLFALYIKKLYPQEAGNIASKIFTGFALLLSAVVLLSPLSVYSPAMLVHQVITVICGVYVFYVLASAVKNKRDSARWFMAGTVFFLLIVLNDILSDHNIINSTFLLPLGLFMFIFSQAFALSLRFSRTFTRIELLTNAYERFVPNNFIKHLNKDDIVEVQLGDSAQSSMTIMFADIRSFTSLSEVMTPAENFKFINSYLERMEPLITHNQGFVDKYIGDEIMALFEQSPDDALNAGIAMLNTLEDYNRHRKNTGYSPIRIGIGINSGELMLGIIGGKNRMDGTVISDAVNLASRMEDMTKQYRTSLLISEDTYRYLQNPDDYNIRLIDYVQVQGRRHSVAIYEVYNNDPAPLKNAKLSNHKLFEQAVMNYQKSDYSLALPQFQHCLKSAPDDQVSQLYIRRIKQHIVQA